MAKFGKPLTGRELRRAQERAAAKHGVTLPTTPTQRPGYEDRNPQAIEGATYAEVIADAERLMPSSVVSLFRDNMMRLEPYRSLGVEALAYDRTHPKEATSRLALTELLASTEHIYDAGWGQVEDFESKAVDAMAALVIAAREARVARATRIASLNQTLMKLTAEHNPLMAPLTVEIAASEEIYHMEQALRFTPDIKKAAQKFKYERSGAENGYRRTLVMNLSQAFDFSVDTDAANASEIGIQDEAELAHISFEQVQWKDVYEAWPGFNTRRYKTPDLSRNVNLGKELASSEVLRTFTVPDADGKPLAQVEILYPSTTYQRFLLDSQLPEPIVHVRITALRGARTSFFADVSRFNGNLCPPMHALISLKTAIGWNTHDRIRNAIFLEIDKALHPNVAQPQQKEAPAHPPLTETAPEAADEEPSFEYAPEPEHATEHTPEEPAATATVWVPELPKRMRIGDVLSTLRRVDRAISIRTGGKHPVIERTVGTDTLMYTGLNEHAGDRRYIPAGIIEDTINALGVSIEDFILKAKGSQARDIRRRMGK